MSKFKKEQDLNKEEHYYQVPTYEFLKQVAKDHNYGKGNKQYPIGKPTPFFYVEFYQFIQYICYRHKWQMAENNQEYINA